MAWKPRKRRFSALLSKLAVLNLRNLTMPDEVIEYLGVLGRLRAGEVWAHPKVQASNPDSAGMIHASRDSLRGAQMILWNRIPELLRETTKFYERCAMDRRALVDEITDLQFVDIASDILFPVYPMWDEIWVRASNMALYASKPSEDRKDEMRLVSPQYRKLFPWWRYR